jgi:Undecaprenyl pyrophosphate synthase
MIFFYRWHLTTGGRNEIIDTVNKLLESNIQKINEDIFSSNLMTKNYPDPDIIIRTGGQKRLSNFLLWQSAYSELFFHEKFWPDFSTDDLDMIIKNYSLRERNFGN